MNNWDTVLWRFCNFFKKLNKNWFNEHVGQEIDETIPKSQVFKGWNKKARSFNVVQNITRVHSQNFEGNFFEILIGKVLHLLNNLCFRKHQNILFNDIGNNCLVWYICQTYQWSGKMRNIVVICCCKNQNFHYIFLDLYLFAVLSVNKHLAFKQLAFS